MTNPLKQYFRRPALYVKLPSLGKFYSADAIDMPDNKEIPVYPMTAIDEITSKTPDALFNGLAVVEIIKSCVPNIKDPWQIPGIDLDAILIAIRVATTGNEMEILSECPKCKNEGKYGVNLTGLLTSLVPGDYNQTLKIDELEIKFKPVSYKVLNESNLAQFEIQIAVNNLEKITDEKEKYNKTSLTMQKLQDVTMKLISNTIESINTPNDLVTNPEYILDFISNTDKKTYELIRDFSIQLRNTSEIKPLQIKCVNCSNEYDQKLTLNVTDFFV